MLSHSRTDGEAFQNQCFDGICYYLIGLQTISVIGGPKVQYRYRLGTIPTRTSGHGSRDKMLILRGSAVPDMVWRRQWGLNGALTSSTA